MFIFQHLQLVIEVLTSVRQVCFCLQGLSNQMQDEHAKFVKLALELSRTALQPLPAWLGIEPITNCCIEVCDQKKESNRVFFHQTVRKFEQDSSIF